MKKKMLIGTTILLVVASLGYAQEPELHGSVDITYLSKYVWRGFDIYDDKSAIQPSVDVDLFGTGFGVSVMGHRANSSEFENGERWDYTLYYGNRLFDGESYATNYRLGYVYYNYPDNTGTKAQGPQCGSFDLQEIHAVLSWPEILPAKGLVPSYVLVKLWPSNSSSSVGSRAATPAGVRTRGTASGFAHIFMLDYGLPVPNLLPNAPAQLLNFHSEAVFNDGVGPNGANVDHDWTNIVFGVSTGFELSSNLALTPGLYYQRTMDDSVNPDQDETWVSLGMSYKF